MDMYELGSQFRDHDMSAEDIYGEIFPDSLQECDNMFRMGMYGII